MIRIGRHKARGIEVEHPAVFPIALPEFVMQAHSDAGDVCYEPFSGSGAAIVAAERTGRRMRAIDLAAAYVDVAVRRWNGLHPDRPARLDGGGAFEAVAAALRTSAAASPSPGSPFYARQIARPDGSAIVVKTEASILPINKRPRLAVRIHSSNRGRS